MRRFVVDIHAGLLLFVWSNELVALTVDIDDFYLVVVLEMLAQLGDVNVHGAGIEVVVVDPDCLECEVALKYLVGMAAQKREQLVLLCGELCLLVTNHKELFLGVEGEAANLVNRRFLVLLATYTA